MVVRTAPVMPDIQPALRLWAHPRPLTAPTPLCPYAAYNSSSTPCPHPTWLRPPPAASQSRTPPRSVPPEATLCHYIQRHARTKAAAQPHQPACASSCWSTPYLRPAKSTQPERREAAPAPPEPQVRQSGGADSTSCDPYSPRPEARASARCPCLHKSP